MLPKKIIITGASGFVGTSLVPKVQQAGYELLLAGRDPVDISRRFKGATTTDYEGLGAATKGFDAVLHLAARNNDQDGDLEAFRAGNVGVMQDVIAACRVGGVTRFINFTTLHAEKAGNTTPYGQSKLEAEQCPEAAEGLHVTHIRLPAVYGTQYKGKLAVLNKVPGVLRKPAFWLLAALKPTVHIDRVYEAVTQQMAQEGAAHVLVTDEQRGNPVYWLFQKVVDLSFAIVIVGLLWWLLLFFWIMIARKSDGPSLFAQQRVGLHGRVFTCWKFRTMQQGTKQAGTHEMGAATLVPMGGFLRKTKIDELPQVWNILKQEVSLVGPRPCLPVQVELVEKRKTANVLSVPVGITGWAQIHEIDMSDPDRLVQWDDEYVKLRSILLDLKIILRTARGSGQGDRTQVGERRLPDWDILWLINLIQRPRAASRWRPISLVSCHRLLQRTLPFRFCSDTWERKNLVC